LPITELVIGFQYKGQFSYCDGDKKIPLASSGLTGLMDHELFRETVSLDHFMLRSELLIREERLQASKTDDEKISLVEQFLISKMNSTLPGLLVASAISMIYKRKDIQISCSMVYICCVEAKKSEVKAIAEDDVELLAIPHPSWTNGFASM